MILRVENGKEKFAAYSHLFGLLLALGGSIILIILSNDIAMLLVVILYSVCMCSMFLGSTLYHASKRTENDQSFWRKFDHIAIYFMIAGSYTVISYIYTNGIFRWIIISVQWVFAIGGTILKVFKLDIPNWLDVGIYLIMGWMIVIRIDFIFIEAPLRIFILVIVGGLAYTIGAVLHAIGKPLPLPGKFEFHDIFHVLIIIGAGLHYLTVLFALLQ